MTTIDVPAIIATYKKNVKSTWLDLFDKEFKEKYFTELVNKIYTDALKNSKRVVPDINNVFRAFTYFDIKQTKCIWLGLDPYLNIENNIPQASGLSFSVPDGFKIPPSLKYIYKELESDIAGFKTPKSGNLTCWAQKEHILLLNSALTTVEKKTGAHLKQWQPFTDKIIKYVSNNCDYIVVIFLGNEALKKKSLIDCNKHGIIIAAHPSPLSASRGFFGSKIFSKTNDMLKVHNITPINWHL
ncbi:MAG: uracil-DNA glycosylase [Faunusvirus sp.]|jgi:uracil-DNA glycosylase|uniref:Uracil-DNA glycosylase n=1 Tax=Faunusvirus sp. TaxID=2487766 RepID=A0A3G4ZX86_9VIRU|nr:MAG: uracil-DNA glycosylase [Faunusvirus sp.]